MSSPELPVVIDATNIGGGGGVTHLKELLSAGELPCRVRVIAQEKVLRQLPDHPLLEKTGHPLLEKSILERLLFQVLLIDRFIPGDAVLFAVSGDFLGRHRPVVSMSQNMLLYEREFWKEMPTFKERIRFYLNYLKQKRSFGHSCGIIFLSEYARRYIQANLELDSKELTVIHHGIAPRFFGQVRKQRPISDYTFSNPYILIYVSTVHVYKNQWNVVEAVGRLRKAGYPVKLKLVGKVLYGPSGRRLEKAIVRTDPDREFIIRIDDIPYEIIDRAYKDADAVIFASTCENMPNILIEAMASGTPVACSDKYPMPEFLKGFGFYFNALDIGSITTTLKDMIDSPTARETLAAEAMHEADRYSWEMTGRKTFRFLRTIVQ